MLASISLLLFDVSIMLNLPIVCLFFTSHPWLHDANKQIRFLKMHYVDSLIVAEKSMTSITFEKCFFLSMMCGLLYTFYGSVFTLIDFVIFTENALYVFKILSIHFTIPAT